jgi:hypothetical protein
VPKIPSSIKSPTQLLQQSRGSLKAVFNHSMVLLAIETVVRNVLESDKHDSVQVASYNKGSLHLVTHSAALATRIKYSQRAMIAALKHLKKPVYVKTVKVSVRPEFHKMPQTTRSAIVLSTESAQYIANAAKYIEDDALRKALIKLSDQTASSD